MIPFPLQRGQLGSQVLYPPNVDADFASCVLLVNAVGPQFGTTFTDQSSIARTITTNNQAQIDRGQYKFNGCSGLFDGSAGGSGDYLSAANSADFNFGTGNFTVECWFRKNTAGTTTFSLVSNYQNSANGFSLQVDLNQLIFNGSGDGVDIRGATAISTNQWYHAAVSGASGSIKLFLDGQQQGSTFTGAVSLNSTGVLAIGALVFSGAPVNSWNGWIAPIRIYKGVAKYTANFTPPALPFPISA